jgi:hypothetical protein
VTATTVDVHLIGFPLDVSADSNEHHEGLLREFALLGLCEEEDGVPRRLQALIDELQDRWSAFAEAAENRRGQAIDAGAATVDLTYRVPRAIREDVLRLWAMLDEADHYCKAGALLTLEAPARVRRFRQWFLGEFVRQIGGEPPVAWTAVETKTDAPSTLSA